MQKAMLIYVAQADAENYPTKALNEYLREGWKVISVTPNHGGGSGNITKISSPKKKAREGLFWGSYLVIIEKEE